MKNWWCEKCNNHWQEEWAKECPDCHEQQDIHVTMSEEEAKEAGLI